MEPDYQAIYSIINNCEYLVTFLCECYHWTNYLYYCLLNVVEYYQYETLPWGILRILGSIKKGENHNNIFVVELYSF